MADTLNLIKTVTADGSSATMDTGTLTGDLDVLRVVVQIEGGGSGGCRMRFNSDTGNNYRRLFSENGGAKDGHNDGAGNGITNMVGRVGRRSYSINTIYNISGKETSGYGNCITDGGNTGSADAPTRMEYAFKWANTAQITSIQIESYSTAWASGSTLNVYAYSREDSSSTDEKQTLADATNDSTQVAGTSDITDLTWTQTVGSSTSDTFYVLKDTSNDLMDVKAAGNCGTESSPSIAYATLSEALGTTYWRMRFKLVFNTVTAESTGGKSFFTNFFIVDNGAVWDTSENGFGFRFIADAGSTQTQFYSMTSGTPSGTTMSWTPSSGSTIYVEISWEGGTATANFYSDSGYSNRVSSTTANATRSGTFSGLKFPQIVLRQDNGGNGVMEIDMSNLEIINRVSVAPPANTQYRETDTRKIYRFSPQSSDYQNEENLFNKTYTTEKQANITSGNDPTGKCVVTHNASNPESKAYATLTNSLNTKNFTIDFTIKRNSGDTGNNWGIFLGSDVWDDNSASGSAKRLTLRMVNGNRVDFMLDVGGETSPEDQTLSLQGTGTTKYYRMTGNGTTAKCEYWSSSDRSGTADDSTGDLTFPSSWLTTDTIDTINFGAWGGGGNAINVEFSDVEITIGSASSWKERGTA